MLPEALEYRGEAPPPGHRSASQNEKCQIVGARSTASVLAQHVEDAAQNLVGMKRAVLANDIEHLLLSESLSGGVSYVDNPVCEEHEEILALTPGLGSCARRIVGHPKRRTMCLQTLR